MGGEARQAPWRTVVPWWYVACGALTLLADVAISAWTNSSGAANAALVYAPLIGLVAQSRRAAATRRLAVGAPVVFAGERRREAVSAVLLLPVGIGLTTLVAGLLPVLRAPLLIIGGAAVACGAIGLALFVALVRRPQHGDRGTRDGGAASSGDRAEDR